MESVVDENCDKRRLLNEVAKCIKTVFIEVANPHHQSSSLNSTSPLVESLDSVLQHGLQNLVRGYWFLVRGCSHSQTLEIVNSLSCSQSSARTKGQAWVLATLVEGSLQSYLQSIVSDDSSVKRFYEPLALLRDPACMSHLYSLLTGLENINFTISNNADGAVDYTAHAVEDFSATSSHSGLDLHLVTHKSSLMTSSSTTTSSSLASPGDSGFTQLDSETDTTSMSEVAMELDTTNDGALLQNNDSTLQSVSGFELHFQKSSNPAITDNDIVNGNVLLESETVTKQLPESYREMFDCDGIVYKRPKNGKIVNKQKRVSFHSDTGELVKEECVPCKPSISERLLTSFKSTASISQAVSDLARLHQIEREQEGVEIGKDSSVFDEECLGALDISTSFIATNQKGVKYAKDNCKETKENSILSAVKTLVVQNKTPSEPRGTPEGQEDLASVCPKSSNENHASKKAISGSPDLGTFEMFTNKSKGSITIPQVRILNSQGNVSQNAGKTLGSLYSSKSSLASSASSKSCLGNKMLKNLTERKLQNNRTGGNKISKPRKPNLYIRGAKPVDELSQEILAELESEFQMTKYEDQEFPPSGALILYLYRELEMHIHGQLSLSRREHIGRVFMVQSGTFEEKKERRALFAILTDRALYLTDRNWMKLNFIYYTQINTVFMGPNGQWVSLASSESKRKLNIVVGDNASAIELVSNIEFAVRRNKVASRYLPAVRYMTVDDVANLSDWTKFLQGESVDHYAVVHVAKDCLNVSRKILESKRKGHFMYRFTNDESSWKPGYFVFRGGVLYHYEDEQEKLCSYILELSGLDCVWTENSSRPYTITAGFLLLAAPDESAAREWLKTLQMASAGAEVASQESSLNSGSLLLTNKRLMLMSSLGIPWESEIVPEILFSTNISNVKFLHVGSSNERWCVLELSSTQGDYIILFNTNREMIAFKNKLSKFLCDESQKVSVVVDSDLLHRRCEEIDVEVFCGWNNFSRN